MRDPISQEYIIELLMQKAFQEIQDVASQQEAASGGHKDEPKLANILDLEKVREYLL